jgi:hypothetical protein
MIAAAAEMTRAVAASPRPTARLLSPTRSYSSKFITAALTAMTTERNTTSSSTMDSATTTPISQGSRAPIRLANETLAAFGPVTYAVSPDRGNTLSCNRFTSASVAASCSPVVG